MDSLQQLLKDEEVEVKEAEQTFPAIVCQKKYDGLRIIIMKSGDKIKIFSDTGLWIEKEFPSLIAWMEKHSWPSNSFVLDCEVDSWISGKHKPREYIAAKVHELKPVPEGQFCVNVFDVLYFDGEDIHKKTQRERLDALKKFNFGQSTVGKPDSKLPMNLAPSFMPTMESQLHRDMNRCIKAPGSEGCMIKLLDAPSSRYSLSGTTTSVLKLKTTAEVHAIVLKVNPTKVSKDTFNYEIGLRFTGQDKISEKHQWKLGNKIYHHIGRTYNTTIRAKPGEVLTVRFHQMNAYKSEKTGERRLHLYEPNVAEKWRERAEPDFYRTALRIGRESGLLVEKETAKNLDLVIPLSPDQAKNFLPSYRRGEGYDTGILEMEEIPEEISKGRWIWFAMSETGIEKKKE